MARTGKSVWRSPAWLLQPALVGALLTAACTRAAVPVPEAGTGTPAPAAGTPDLTAAPTPEPIIAIQPFVEQTYAVVWVPQDQALVVRQPAGISSVGVSSLVYNQGGIRITGKTTLLGSSQWLEINRPDSGTGWVNGWNLTEEVGEETFCQDVRVLDLLARLTQALTARDGPRLAELISPRHGLIVRHDAWNPEVFFEAAAVSELFESPTVLDWGILRDSQVQILGTFEETILPKLDQVFNAAPEVSCNQLGAGSSAQEPRWPSEYDNLNFYSFYRRAPEPGNRLNWHTWAIGIEYVGGQPYVAVLVYFQGEI
jgi:hypothetical protein